MKLYVVLISMMVMGAGMPLGAQDAPDSSVALTLEQAQLEAIDNSPVLQKMKAADDEASWGELEAVSPYVPHLSVDGSQVLDQQYLYLGVDFGGEALNFPEATPTSLLDLNASETIFDGFQAWHRYRSAGLEHDATELDFDNAKFRLREMVRLRYYQALAATLLAGVADQNIQTLEAHLGNAQDNVQSGLATRFDVLRVQSKLEEARAEKQLEDDNVVVAQGALLQVLGLPGPDARPITGDLPVPDANLVTGLDLSQTSRTDIEAMEKRLEAARQSKSAEAGFWFPSVSVFGQKEYYKYESYDPVIIPSNGYQDDYTVGLNLKWDLFDGGLSLAKQEEAGEKVKEQEATLKAEILKVPLDLEQWRRRYLYNVVLYQARQRAQDECKESVRLANLGLQAGTRTHTELLDAESDLFQASAGIVQAQMDAAEALVNLEQALGHSLEQVQ